MSVIAKALYGFDAASDVELALQPGDIILVTRMDVGGGWWEGRLVEEGSPLGLFPEHYVELLPTPPKLAPTSAPKSHQAPIPVPRQNSQISTISNKQQLLLQQQQQQNQNYHQNYNQQQQQQQHLHTHHPTSNPASPYAANVDTEEDEDEDFGDDYGPSSSSEPPTVPPTDYGYGYGYDEDYYEDDHQQRGRTHSVDDDDEDDEEASSSDTGGHQISSSPSSKSDKKDKRVASPSIEQPYRIVEGPSWERTTWPVTVTVSKPEKKSKYSGMKQFTAYSVSSSSMKTAVKRRYKHFNWLHNRLGETFPGISIPPMPEKVLQANFKFDDSFIEKRRRGLERFLNRVAAHPVLGTSNVFLHFLTAAEKAGWKSGKRFAEKAAEKSAFVETMEVPTNNVPDNRVMIVERFAKVAKAMEKNVTYLAYTCEHFQNKRGELKTEYGKLSYAFKRIVHSEKEGSSTSALPSLETPTGENQWCWKDDCEMCAPLVKGFEMMNTGIGKIATFMDMQKLSDTIPLMEFLKDYTGILKTFPSIIKAHENAVEAYNQAMLKDRENTEGIAQHKIRTEKLSNITLAEFEHFHQLRLQDFKDMMDNFIQEQVAFHKKVASMWEEMLPYFGAILNTDRI